MTIRGTCYKNDLKNCVMNIRMNKIIAVLLPSPLFHPCTIFPSNQSWFYCPRLLMLCILLLLSLALVVIWTDFILLFMHCYFIAVPRKSKCSWHVVGKMLLMQQSCGHMEMAAWYCFELSGVDAASCEHLWTASWIFEHCDHSIRMAECLFWSSNLAIHLFAGFFC